MKVCIGLIFIVLLCYLAISGQNFAESKSTAKEASIIIAPPRNPSCGPGKRWANGSCRRIFRG